MSHTFRGAKSKGAGHELDDLEGISPPNQPEHPWQHFSEFKVKVGGEEVRLATPRDLVFDLRRMTGSGRSRILFDLRESGLAL